MNIARLLAIASCLLLAACYESQSMLLDTSDSKQPISTYQDWRYKSSSGSRFHARLNPRSDGWYEYSEAMIQNDGSEGTWKHFTVLLNYLQSANGMEIYVFGTKNSGGNYVYGLVAFMSGGGWQSFTPDCDIMSEFESDLEAAKQAGASVTSTEDYDACVFTSRTSLLAAMRNVVSQPSFAGRIQKAATSD